MSSRRIEGNGLVKGCAATENSAPREKLGTNKLRIYTKRICRYSIRQIQVSVSAEVDQPQQRDKIKKRRIDNGEENADNIN